MKKLLISLMACTLLCVPSFCKTKNKTKADLWPDGTTISEWFRQNDEVDLTRLGRQYRVTDYGVVNDGLLHTKELQALIDKAAEDGGGVIVVPEGTYIFRLILTYFDKIYNCHSSQNKAPSFDRGSSRKRHLSAYEVQFD